MKILNLTQHQSTPEQGVVDLPKTELDVATSIGLRPDQFGFYKDIGDVLTFRTPPTEGQMWSRAVLLAAVAAKHGADAAMIGGAPFFMSVLEKALAQRGIQPLYAFSVRESVEAVQPDGSVVKTNVFRHVDFVKGTMFPIGLPEDGQEED